ncbi:DUF1853 family protein [Eikenella sp. Marseille-P7795]|uniref:DUF1853 family protein n=1 Tax=Eikenella sp. Marseille-P7795 TaxID=2866577 RepID=UPI001CE425DA|nr:DUF1853 family protein [Eikenella sp. Marseille-P7795]
MNYALDALWWQLRHPAARDLAALLTPAPVAQRLRAPVAKLLGGHGFRFLLRLDQEPAPLQHWLQQEAPFGQRLGHYAESLLAFWLSHAPHCQLIARNHPIRDTNGRTLGAADFLCLIHRQPHHLELTCKYYGGRSPRTARPQPRRHPPTKPPKSGSKPNCCTAPPPKPNCRTASRLPETSPRPAPHRHHRARHRLHPKRHTQRRPAQPLGWSGLLLKVWADYPPSPSSAHPCPASPTSPPPACPLSTPSLPPSSPASRPASSPWLSRAPTACGTKLSA